MRQRWTRPLLSAPASTTIGRRNKKRPLGPAKCRSGPTSAGQLVLAAKLRCNTIGARLRGAASVQFRPILGLA